MTEERKTELTELIENRIAHRKSEEKYFYINYEKENPFHKRDCTIREYMGKLKKAFDAHMAEYEELVALRPN